MLNLLKQRLPKSKVIGATLFMAIQVMTTLYLPTLTSNIVNNGVAKGDVHYIWTVGIQMMVFSLISVAAAAVSLSPPNISAKLRALEAVGMAPMIKSAMMT